MTTLRGVLFDKDGTLFDFASTWEVWAEAFLHRIAQGDTVLARSLGRAVGFDFDLGKFRENSIVIAGTPAEVTLALHAHLPDWQPAALLDVLNEEAEVAPQVEAVPLKPFLQQLRDMGQYLGVVTNDAEQPARAHLRAAGVTENFDFIAGFDSGYGAKPDPGPLLAFAKAVNVAPQKIVMVGDSTHDLLAAKRAGMRAVGVLTGLAEAETLAPLAEAVFPDIGHIPDWLAVQNAA